MNDPKKGMVRIPVPSKPLEGRSENQERPVRPEPALDGAETSGGAVSGTSLRGARTGTKGVLRPVPKRDPALVPLIGILLAFCLIALIVQLLIALG